VFRGDTNQGGGAFQRLRVGRFQRLNRLKRFSFAASLDNDCIEKYSNPRTSKRLKPFKPINP
jgi:hypothetical protein